MNFNYHPTMPRIPNLPARAISLSFAATLLFFAGYSFIHFLAAGRDDTFIMLWAGQSLGSASWFANYNHESQEIASSILGVAIAALTRGMSTEHSLLFIKLAGLSAGCATLGLLWWRRNRVFAEFENGHLLAFGAVFATALSPCFQYWSLGGLETPYHALLLLMFCLLLASSISNTSQSQSKTDWLLAGVCILLVLVRTEGFWAIFLAGAFLLSAKRCFPISSPRMRAVYVALIFFAGLLAMRNLMTGATWPDPVYAKVGGLEDAIPTGFRYLLDYYQSSPWAWLQAMAFFYGMGAVIRFGICMFKRTVPGEFLVMQAVIGATVFLQQMFVMLTGGNWMEYFRFVAAIIPLLNILVFCMTGFVVMRIRQAGYPVMSLCLSVVTVLFSMSQVGRAEYYVGRIPYGRIELHPGNCATAIDKSVLSAGLDGISSHMIFGNCANGRDWMTIKPFIDEKLPDLLKESGGHLTVVSYQAGFFPYFLRKQFTPDQVRFVDSLGITDLAIARLPGHKASTGNRDGIAIDLALAGKSGALSEYLAKMKPEMVYMLGAGQPARDNFAALKYEVVWEQPGAIVFFRRPKE